MVSVPCSSCLSSGVQEYQPTSCSCSIYTNIDLIPYITSFPCKPRCSYRLCLTPVARRGVTWTSACGSCAADEEGNRGLHCLYMSCFQLVLVPEAYEIMIRRPSCPKQCILTLKASLELFWCKNKRDVRSGFVRTGRKNLHPTRHPYVGRGGYNLVCATLPALVENVCSAVIETGRHRIPEH